MRLAEMCASLSAAAFQLNVYDSSAMVLVEVSSGGVVALSGFGTHGDALKWHEERLSEEFIDARFRMLPYQDLIVAARLGDDKAAIIARRFGGKNEGLCDNLVSVDTLISHKPFDAPGGLALYFAWPGPSRARYASTDSWAEHLERLRKGSAGG
jgi:hypothetical protein